MEYQEGGTGFTFGAAANTAADPHPGIQMKISSISSFHVDIDSERVCLGVDIVYLGRIFKFLQDLSWADSPTIHLNSDEGRWVVVSL